VFVDVYLSPLENLLRADVNDELEDQLPAGCEIVGAGAGLGGANIDIEMADRKALPAIVSILRSIGVRADTVLFLSDTRESRRLDDFP
jgi:hypothetical protein